MESIVTGEKLHERNCVILILETNRTQPAKIAGIRDVAYTIPKSKVESLERLRRAGTIPPESDEGVPATRHEPQRQFSTENHLFAWRPLL